jgi:ketosteroid isomerase-like protein
MGEERIAAVRRYFEALEHTDFGGALELLDEDFEFDYSRSRGPLQGVYRGKADLKRWYENFLEAFSEFEALETEIAEIGDHVLRVGGFRARGRGSGVEAKAFGATVWSFRGNVPIKAVLYQSKEDALADIG